MAIIKPTLNLVASEYTPEILNVTRASGATRVNAAGLVERVGSGTLRYDYDPTTFAGKGWLIEEARTNYILQSSNIGNTTPWYMQTITTATDTTLAPDGTLAWKLKEDNTTNVHRADYWPSVCAHPTTGTYVMSGYFKAAERNIAQLENAGANATAGAQNYILTGDGSLGASTGTVTDAGIVAYPNGWYFCWMACEVAATGGALHPLFEIRHTDDHASYQGVTGNGLYMWGAGYEKGSFPTSYIPTTTAAVTRAQDTPIVNTADIPDFNDGGEGSLYFHGSCPDVSALGNATFAQLDNGPASATYRIGFYGSSLTTQILVNSASQVALTGGSISDNTEFRFAVAFKTDSINDALNGTAGTEDATGNIPDNLSDIQFGNTYGHSDMFAMHIKHFALFPVRLIDADLETITTG
jgi:hypothetical protein